LESDDSFTGRDQRREHGGTLYLTNIHRLFDNSRKRELSAGGQNQPGMGS